MSVTTLFERWLQTMRHLDEAEALLNGVRVHERSTAVRDALAHQRAALVAARCHIESARALQAAG